MQTRAVVLALFICSLTPVFAGDAPTAAPTITAPTGAGNFTTPTISWTTVPSATLFDCWIDDVTSGASQVLSEQALTTTSFTPAVPLTDNHAYRIWVRVGNEFGFGPWSSEQDFGVGAAPIAPPTATATITAPTGSANSTTPTLQWTAVAQANRYDLWIDSLTSGQSQVIRQQAEAGTSFTVIAALAGNSSYRAWVRAGNEFGFGGWSAAQDFGVGAAPIAPPTGVATFIAPTGTGNATTPALEWTAIPESNRYDLWIDDYTNGQSQVIRQPALPGTSFTFTVPLTNNHAYRAWVRGGNEFGFGSWSAAQDFGVGTAPIAPPTGTPTVLAPTGTGNSTTPTVQWGAVPEANRYDLWIDDYTTGQSQVIRQPTLTATSFTVVAALSDSHSYRAWVRAGNEFGFGSWSAAQDFGVGTAPVAPPTGTPTVVAPTGAGNTTTPLIEWTAGAESNRYDVWIDNATTGASQALRQLVTGTSFTPTVSLSNNNSYRLWVRAGNEFGFGPWSNEQVFGVGTASIAPPTGTPTVTAPTGTGNSATPTFEWTAVAEANRFDLWVDDYTLGTSQVIRQLVTTNSFTATVALTDTHAYRIWVRAGNEFGFGSWSAAKDFGVGAAPIAPPTGTPTVLSPIGTVNTTTPMFEWTNVADSNRFDLWVDDITSGESQVIRQPSLTGTSFTPAVALADNHSYRTWVRAGNEFGFGPWSNAADFYVHLSTPTDTLAPIITFQNPANNAFTTSSSIYVTFMDAVPPAESTEIVTGINLDASQFYFDGTDVRAGASSDSLSLNSEFLSQGEHFLSITLVDFAGNSATYTSTFTYDTTPPQIPSLDIVLEATSSADVSVALRTVLDNLTAQPEVHYFLNGSEISSPYPFAITGANTPYSVSVYAVDEAGNSATGSFNVYVQDTTPPEILSVAGNITVTAPDTNGAYIDAPLELATLFDIVDSAPSSYASTSLNAVFPIGTTTVYVYAYDRFYNYSQPAFFDVTVLPPPIQVTVENLQVSFGLTGIGQRNLNGELQYLSNAMSIGVYTTTSAMNATSITLSYVVSGPPGTTSVSGESGQTQTFELQQDGIYTVTATATASNEFETRSVSSPPLVFVIDRTPPTIIAPDVVAESTSPNGTLVSFGATATDEFSSGLAVQFEFGTLTSPALFPLYGAGAIGSNQVRASTTDEAGNYAETTFTVSVVDTTPPPTAPSNLVVHALSSSALQLDWVDNSDNEAFFQIQRSYNGQTTVFVVPAGTTSYIDDSFSAGAFAGYVVRASNGLDLSSESNFASDYTWPTVGFLQPVVHTSEFYSEYTFGVYLSSSYASPITISYAVTGGTAQQGIDYTFQSGQVTFAPFQTYASFSINVIDDSFHEADETVQISLSRTFTPSTFFTTNNVSLGEFPTVTLIIHDDDPAPVDGFMITTVAGNGIRATTGDGGPATAASLKNPFSMAVDGSGNMYIAETNGFRVRRVDAVTGIISTIAGNGTFGSGGDGGPAVLSPLDAEAVALDYQHNVYIAGNQTIRKVDSGTGIITTVAANRVNISFVCVDHSGNVIFTESTSHRVIKINAQTGAISLVAGNGISGFSGDGGLAVNAKLQFPNGIGVDTIGNVYIGDTHNHRVRKVNVATGVISTVAGNGTPGYFGDGGVSTNASLNTNFGLAISRSNDIFIADFYNYVVRKVDGATGIITTVAGNGTYGFSGDGGSPLLAAVGQPTSIALDGTRNFYFTGYGERVRKVWNDTPLRAPSNLTANVTGITVHLNWIDNATDESAYIVERKPGILGKYVEIAMLAGNTTQFNDPVGAGSYYYRVRSANAAAVSAFSNQVNIENKAPAAPTNLMATVISNSRIDLSWTDNAANEEGYKVERRPSNSSVYAEIASLSMNAHDYSDNGILPEVRYFYRVRAVNSIGSSAYSNEVSALFDATPPVVTIVFPSNGSYINDPLPSIKGSMFDASGILPVITSRLLDNVPMANQLANNTENFSFQPTALLSEGPHTIQVNAADASGNTAQASVSFVLDITRPVITVSADVTAQAIGAGAFVSFNAATATDNFTDQPLVNYDHESGSFFPYGTTVVTITATDDAGNSSTADFKITVTGTVVPPLFTNLTPVTAWVKTPRPVIGGDVETVGVDFNSLFVEVERLDVAPPASLLAGLLPTVTQSHFELATPFDFQDGQYRVQATIRNAEGVEATTSWDFGVDKAAPDVVRMLPLTETQLVRPGFHFVYSDLLSGIDPNSICLTVGGVDITEFAQFDATELHYTPDVDLSFGVHSFLLQVADIADNSATLAGSVVVIDPNADITPPIFASGLPANGSFVSCKLVQPAVISLLYSDAMAGVDVNSIQFRLDGVEFEPTTVSGSHLTFVLDTETMDGPHTWTVTLSDLQGNTNTYISSLIVDSTAPSIVSFRPNRNPLAPVELMDDHTLKNISIVLSEPGAGVDWSTLSMKVHGTEYAHLATASGVSAVLQLPTPMRMGVSRSMARITVLF